MRRRFSIQGRHAEAVAQTARARETRSDLRSRRATIFSSFFVRAAVSAGGGRLFQRSLEVNPKFWPLHLFLGETYGQLGQYPEALAELRKGARAYGTGDLRHRPSVRGAPAQKSEAEKALAELLQREKKRGTLPASYNRWNLRQLRRQRESI